MSVYIRSIILFHYVKIPGMVKFSTPGDVNSLLCALTHGN